MKYKCYKVYNYNDALLAIELLNDKSNYDYLIHKTYPLVVFSGGLFSSVNWAEIQF